MWERTEFLLDHFQNFLLIELLGKTLNSGQGLSTIALCGENYAFSSGTDCAVSKREKSSLLTLNSYMYVILRLLGLAGIFVSFGEGVCERARVRFPVSTLHLQNCPATRLAMVCKTPSPVYKGKHASTMTRAKDPTC